MIYYFLYPLREYFFIFNLAKYITVRGACAFATSFLIVMLLWKSAVNRLKRLKIGEKIDMYGHVHLEALHGQKKGTPTMGGLLILISVFLSVILWTRLDSYLAWYVLFVMLSLGLVGLRDDLLKVRTGRGLRRIEKLFLQVVICSLAGVLLTFDPNISSVLSIPFLKALTWELGGFYILWVIMVVVSTSNAVNFTDGLDGLAIGAVVVNCFVFALLSYIAGHSQFARYLFVPYIEGAGELSVVCAAVAGAGLAFLWFNSHPAEIFMGDVGALSLGGTIGIIALLIKKEFLLLIAGGLFVVEALSVVMQIFSVRLRGKKILKAAPLHHHLQLVGWSESKIVIRFWIIAFLCAIFSLMTLKLR